MTIGINCGHTVHGAGNGAVGLIKESEHTRLVGYALMKKLRDSGIKAVDCTVNKADSQQQYLEKAIALANREELDWFISIHFNASASHAGHGTEIYTYKGYQYPEVLDILSNMVKLGFAERGIKDGSGLYVIRKTKARAMLIEVCFCDNREDIDIYNLIGAEEAVAHAIFSGIYKYAVKAKTMPAEYYNFSFTEYVGKIAQKDWKERRIVLPSVVVAQAIKESAWGTSELAKEANALFGIKKNGWLGRTYIKPATEQREDGSFYTIDNTEWRAYDNWEQSILDHNDYLATRSTDGGKTLRYQPVIGCNNYVLACQYLQKCGYATAVNYDESLINDYIEKYDLARFDQ